LAIAGVIYKIAARAQDCVLGPQDSDLSLNYANPAQWIFKTVLTDSGFRQIFRIGQKQQDSFFGPQNDV